MAITTIIPTFSVLPQRSDPSNFSVFRDIWLTEEQLRITLTNDVADEMNTVSAEVNNNAQTAIDKAAAAAASALQAESLLNSKGAWSELTGTLNVPASVTHTESVWVLNVNLANVTISEPIGGNSDWTEVSGVTQQELDLKADKVTLDKRLCSIPASKLLVGEMNISNTINTKTFDSITYTGNGTNQDIVTGINSVDFTVAFNGSGYWLDRTTFEVKTDAGSVVGNGTTDWKLYDDTSGETPRGISKVHIKGRSVAFSNHVFDGLRGAGKFLYSDSTIAEAFGLRLLSFNADGFSLDSNVNVNQSTKTYISYTTLYTKVKWGVTNQGKKYVEAYNPVTKETMIMYEGSSTDGHEIPHSLGIKLNFVQGKSLTSIGDWSANRGIDDTYLSINQTIAESSNSSIIRKLRSNFIELGSNGQINDISNIFIMYGKANSKTWTIVEYNGTGVADNFVETVDDVGVGRRPARVIIKKTNGIGGWALFDNNREVVGQRSLLLLDLANAEDTTISDDYGIVISETGFTPTGNASVDFNNVSQYIALVEFDTNSNGGGSYADLPTLNTNIEIIDRQMIFSDGFENGHAKNTSETNVGTELIAPVWLDGKNYVKKIEGGAYVPTLIEPLFGEVSVVGDYYINGKWYDLNDTELPTQTYLDNTVFANAGLPTLIEEWKVPDIVVDKIVSKQLKIDNIALGNLPTVDPLIANEVWNNAGVLTLSSGV